MRTLFVCALVAAATPARADFTLAVGLKWLPVNYTRPVTATMGGASGPTPTPLEGWQTTSLDNDVGAFFLDGRLGVQLSLDLGYGSRHEDATTAGITNASDFSFTQFGFSLGGKYYFTTPRRERVSPYVLVDFFKYFASVSTTDKTVPNDQAAYVAGLASPLGFDLAFGAEYFVTEAFSIGAEILGLKYAYSEGDFTVAGGFGGDSRITAKNQYLTLYTGISLNYRFAFSGSIHAKPSGNQPDPDEAPGPRRRAAPPSETAPPPSAEPPPENPEEVD